MSKMTKQAKIRHLAGVVSGRWLVTTAHSEYYLDLDSMVATRVAGKQANKWHDEDVTYPLRSVPSVEVGERMAIPVDHPDEWVYSTPVKSIVPLWDDVA